MEIQGHCHCGNVRYLLESDRADGMTLRICRCDFCLRHRPRYWSDPEGTVRFEIDEPDAVLRYRFGQRTADFLVCRRCGVFCGAIAEIDGSRYAVLNMNLALSRGDMPPEAFIEALDEIESERTARRARSWTPVTGVLPG